MSKSKGNIVVYLILVLLVVFFVSPFIYKAVTGTYPVGFPLKNEQITLDSLKDKKQRPLDDPSLDKNMTNWYSDEELAAAKKLMVRNYPQFIKSNLEPSAPYVKKALEEDVQGMKNLGVNTIGFYPNYHFVNNTLSMSDNPYHPADLLKKEVTNWIIKAKSHGFAVHTGPVTIPFEPHQGDAEAFLKQAEPIILEWAKIAQDYQVEYFSPFAEIEERYLRFSNNPSEAEKKRVWLRVNQFSQKLLPKVREVFKGQVLYIVVSDIAEEASAKGFDIYGVDFGGTPNKSKEDFRLEARQRYKKAARVAQRDGVKWMVGELYIHHSCLNDGHTAYCPAQEILEQQVADYYQVALDEFVKLQDTNKVGFVFDAYTFPAQKIKGTAAETIVKKYFSQF